ncbi:bifunctional riboflavin kinase and FAD synthetase [Candidatus Filomicrobium marinum]|uniref:Riboflavin biosynthesis protein n=2 Tax=Filomicrobium TaxID=119044 RepID=A0A0D6J9P6_9HYPH|nr:MULTISPECIES: bifunctional riboflavin kinase/FAD synthetase [Filomicrobium]MCV0368773.1 bifunctional riboflavin kinase/FAD synthetase [Filomicrobium sp.]CFW98762.1 bifunctional riboflavin kinase and FAD synthetase [Candidatus Filomicrobium marinum]CPR14951.1 bifunctional riboflavin kinase and FAD synthetase [Candidatus Filomicrobium marinum]SDO72975.1 riboflavin kinase / FMN adenylyltransferase [Filomicrobium insigne]
MLVVHGSLPVPDVARGAVLAIGNFDGVHRGHKALLAEAVKTAKALSRKAGAVIFEPQPREFFHPEEAHFRLTPLSEKLRLLELFGLDLVAVLDFNAELAGLSADQFVETILVRTYDVAHVVIGYDFRFGKARAGTPESLCQAGEKHGFGVSVINQQAEEGEVFSSTAIRLHLAQGDVRGAAHALGHWWRVAAPVISGQKLGTELGFPTANVELPRGTALRHGIYAARVVIGDEIHDGAAYFGTRPSADDGPVRLEVFILDFQGDLYDREIAIEFVDFIREDKRFETFDALKAQIVEDCVQARAILSAVREKPPII